MDTWQTGLLIIGILALIYIMACVREFMRWRKANQKTKAAEPVDATDWLVYDSTGAVKTHRKQTRRELYEDIKEKGGISK